MKSKHLKKYFFLVALFLASFLALQEKIVVYLVTSEIEKRGISLQWSNVKLDMKSKQTRFSNVKLTPNINHDTKLPPTQFEELSVNWDVKYQFLVSIQSINFIGLNININEPTTHTLSSWLYPLISVKQNKPAPLISCMQCTFKWSYAEQNPASEPQYKSLLSDDSVHLEYYGDFFMEQQPSPIAKEQSGTQSPRQLPRAFWFSKGQLNGNHLDLTGTFEYEDSPNAAFLIKAFNEPLSKPIEILINKHLLLKTKPQLKFIASLVSSDHMKSLRLSQWNLDLDFSTGGMIMPTKSHPYLTEESKIEWQTGRLNMHWAMNNADEPKQPFPIIHLNISGLAAHIKSSILSSNSADNDNTFFSLSGASATSLFQHQEKIGWIAKNTILKKLSIFSERGLPSASGGDSEYKTGRQYEISMNEIEIQKITFATASNHNSDRPIVASGTQSENISIHYYNKNDFNQHWSYWLANNNVKSPLLSFKDFSSTTSTKIQQVSLEHEVENQIEFEPFQTSLDSSEATYLFTLQSKHLNILSDSKETPIISLYGPIEDDKKKPNQPLPEAKIILNRSQQECSFKTVIQLGELTPLRELYDYLGPPLAEANLPIYLADIFTPQPSKHPREVEEPNLIYLGNKTCDLSNAYTIIESLFNEMSKTIVEKSTNKIRSINPQYSSKLINRYSESSDLNELIIGQLNFEPLSNQFSLDQKIKFQQILKKLKKIVALSDKVQIRIETAVNEKDINLWNKTQKPSAKTKDSNINNLATLARQRGLYLKKMLLENGIARDQIYLSLPKYQIDPFKNDISTNAKILL